MITLKTLRYKNLLSSGNTMTEIQLDKNDKTLLAGKNGNGKSVVLDAITFALFGKPFRKISKPQLVNSINGRDCYTEMEFSVGKNEYIVRRGIKPNILEIECNGKVMNKSAKQADDQKYLETHILKLNYKSFTQIVILGSASFVPFMQLSNADRRVVVEDILDIQIFSAMRDILKERNSILRDDFSELENGLSLLDSKIEIQETHLQEIKKKRETGVAELQELINTQEDKLHMLEVENRSHQKDVDEMMTTTTGHQKAIANKKQYNSLLDKIASNKKSNEKEFDFFESNQSCPVCTQDITDDFRQEKENSCITKRYEYGDAIIKLQEKLQLIETELSCIENNQKHIDKINRKIANNNNQINIANSIIKTHQERISSFDDNEDTNDEKVITLHKEKEGKLSDRVVLTEKKYYNNIIANLLTDTGIKTKVIKQYLPIINKRVNAYLVDMDAYFNFELDETFSEKIESRYRDDFSYASFSEGEKKRIDIALLLTWRDIASMKNSVDINLLFLDEIFDSSLDASGVDDVMKLFDTLKNTNLFIISHRGDLLEDKFENKIRVKKEKKFTIMEQE